MNENTDNEPTSQVVTAVRKRSRPRRRENRTVVSSCATSGRPRENENETQNDDCNPLPREVILEDGLFDKLTIKAEHGYVKGEQEEMDIFRKCLGAAPKNSRNGIESGNYGKLCTVSPFNGEGIRGLAIRTSSLKLNEISIPKPLFSGRINMRRVPIGNSQKCFISSDLHFNLSRAVNHCAHDSSVFELDDRSDLMIGLDGNDNIVPSDFPKSTVKNIQDSHIEKCYSFLEKEIKRSSASIDGFCLEGAEKINTSKLSTREVEIYWEIETRNSLNLLDSLMPLLRGYHKKIKERTHGFDDVINGNAKSVTLYLGAGEEIVIYAKTLNKLRIEVRFKPHKQDLQIKNGYCAPNVQILRSKLKSLKLRALERVNSLLSYLNEWLRETPQERASTARFASRWFQILGHGEDSENLLEMLRLNGRVIRGQCLNRQQQNLIRRAKNKGLVFSDHGKIYPSNLSNSLTKQIEANRNLAHNTETQAVSLMHSNDHSIRVSGGGCSNPALSAIQIRLSLTAEPFVL